MKKMMMMVVMLVMLVLTLGGFKYAYQGVKMHNQVPAEEARFHELQQNYFNQAKSVRDAAKTDSELNMQLVEINQYPSRLLELKLVGIGEILTGIFLILVSIMIALVMMPMRLASEIKKK